MINGIKCYTSQKKRNKNFKMPIKLKYQRDFYNGEIMKKAELAT